MFEEKSQTLNSFHKQNLLKTEDLNLLNTEDKKNFVKHKVSHEYKSDKAQKKIRNWEDIVLLNKENENVKNLLTKLTTFSTQNQKNLTNNLKNDDSYNNDFEISKFFQIFI